MGALRVGLLLILAIGCGKNVDVTPPPVIEKEQVVEKTQFLNGEINLVSGETVDLRGLTQQSTLLIFASETCSICRKEAKLLSKLIKDKGTPQNISIYTVVLGGYPEDAEFWAKSLGITWDVAVDIQGDPLFKRYCPERLTPCVIILNPEQDKITKFIGESSINAWQEETGVWTY